MDVPGQLRDQAQTRYEERHEYTRCSAPVDPQFSDHDISPEVVFHRCRFASSRHCLPGSAKTAADRRSHTPESTDGNSALFRLSQASQSQVDALIDMETAWSCGPRRFCLSVSNVCLAAAPVGCLTIITRIE